MQFSQAQDFPPALLEKNYYLQRSVVLIISGSLVALISWQIKRQMLHSYQAVAQKDKVISLFGQHVSPEVVEMLLNQKGSWEGEIRYVSIMFMDIRGFTAFVHARPPQEVVTFLNTIFALSVDIINENHGIINKFLGDGFMAVFGAPVSDGKDAQNAVAAALKLLRAIEDAVGSGALAPTRAGIGIHSGDVLTGHVGSQTRKEYTVIGNAVNLASRIESLNKTFQTSCLVSEDIWKKLSKELQAEGRFLEKVSIRGASGQIAIYSFA